MNAGGRVLGRAPALTTHLPAAILPCALHRYAPPHTYREQNRRFMPPARFPHHVCHRAIAPYRQTDGRRHGALFMTPLLRHNIALSFLVPYNAPRQRAALTPRSQTTPPLAIQPTRYGSHRGKHWRALVCAYLPSSLAPVMRHISSLHLLTRTRQRGDDALSSRTRRQQSAAPLLFARNVEGITFLTQGGRYGWAVTRSRPRAHYGALRMRIADGSLRLSLAAGKSPSAAPATSVQPL